MSKSGTRLVIAFFVSVLFVILTGGAADACQCLTRTPGFWGTHPDITETYLTFDSKTYLPVCGKKLDTVDTGACSAIQAMCVAVGVESTEEGVPPQLLQLIRQIAAARLNLRATWTEGGGCTEEINNLVSECDQLCEDFTEGDVTTAELKESDCIDQLNAFNNSPDTFMQLFPPFDDPGAADSSACRASTGDTVQITDCTQND